MTDLEQQLLACRRENAKLRQLVGGLEANLSQSKAARLRLQADIAALKASPWTYLPLHTMDTVRKVARP